MKHQQGLSRIILGFSITFSILACLNVNASISDFNVQDYGAVGDGTTDDSLGFLLAWNDTCNWPTGSPTLIIPEGKVYLVNPLRFNGPCKSSNINVQISGTIMAPANPHSWNGHDPSEWMGFYHVAGLNIDGYGALNGNGYKWWAQSCKETNNKKGCTKVAPTALKLIDCDNANLSNLRFINSSQVHLTLHKCHNFFANNLNIQGPGSSPNTDGIHISSSQNVVINDTVIGTGDDCISIGDHTLNFRITNINCGPGHGISIGSLGEGGANVQVENIYVSNANFYKSTNGVRIKTWPGGLGYARRITFENLRFDDVKNPIIIDQYYGDEPNPKFNSSQNVKISDVTYRRAFGTSSSKVAIKLNCATADACTGILLDSIHLTSGHGQQHGHHQGEVVSQCNNAHGRVVGGIEPGISCLIQD